MSIFNKTLFAGVAVISMASGITAEARSLKFGDDQYGQECFNRCITTGKHTHRFCEYRCKISMPRIQGASRFIGLK
jgi:hypothetical protein